MKKFFAILISATMMVSLVACGGNDSQNATDNSQVSQESSVVTEESTDAGENAEVNDNSDAGDSVATGDVIAPEFPKEGTYGEMLWNEFLANMEADATGTVLSDAEKMMESENILFAGGATEMAPGYLAGFSADITGFESAAHFGPFMGSIAFAGYVFELAEDADVNAFMQTLKDNCDPAWQLCVQAEQTVVGAYGNKVFFLMCPIEIMN